MPLDDPRLPMIEHRIARGDMEDPSPGVRPFPWREDEKAGRRDKGASWRIDVRGGLDASTADRRDLLHPDGDGGVDPYFDLRLEGVFENLVLVTRPAIEPRVTDDPDWPGRRNVDVAGRLLEGYVAAQFKYARFLYGQLEHNWGPVGLPGIPLSNYGYERQGLFVELGNRTVRLSALATDLADGPDSAGVINHRYYFVHRLGVRLSPRVFLAAWEGNVLAGDDRNFETRYRNPLSFGYLANTVGIGDRGNEILGLDARWQAFGKTTLEAQVAIDDFWYKDRDQNRDRWALTFAAWGPLGRTMSWRAVYSQVSSLALRAFNRAENFTDAGVGIGRNFSDNDHFLLRVSVPVRDRWLVTPELAFFRQGEGRIEDPYPVQPELADTPALFIGTVERTLRAAVALSGKEGPVGISGEVGFHRVMNAGHLAGVTENRVEARVRGTLGVGWTGTIRD